MDLRHDHVLIAVNPNAGATARRTVVDQLASRLTAAGLRVEIETQLTVLIERIQETSTAGRLRAVVAAGGDGTVAELINRTEPGVPIALLPLGTENLLAKYLGIRPDVDSVCRTILGGSEIRLDAGRANGRLFTLMASCGFDADVLVRINRSAKGHISHLSYARPILSAIRHYPYPPLRITYRGDEDDQLELTARWAFAFNLPCYACRIPLAPQANGTDGRLDLCTFERGGLGRGLWYLANTILHHHERLADWHGCRVRQVRIDSDVAVPYQLDGDAVGQTPLEIDVLPGRLTLLAPPEWLRLPEARRETKAAYGSLAQEPLPG